MKNLKSIPIKTFLLVLCILFTSNILHASPGVKPPFLPIRSSSFQQYTQVETIQSWDELMDILKKEDDRRSYQEIIESHPENGTQCPRAKTPKKISRNFQERIDRLTYSVFDNPSESIPEWYIAKLKEEQKELEAWEKNKNSKTITSYEDSTKIET